MCRPSRHKMGSACAAQGKVAHRTSADINCVCHIMPACLALIGKMQAPFMFLPEKVGPVLSAIKVRKPTDECKYCRA